MNPGRADGGQGAGCAQAPRRRAASRPCPTRGARALAPAFARVVAGACVALAIALPFAPPARADDDSRFVRAMRSLSEADARFREGRLADALQAYVDLLREFPTWWLPTLKAGVVAQALGLPPETVRGWVERARGLLPSGVYLPLVDGLLAPGVPRDPLRVEGAEPPAVRDPLADRMSLLRAARLAAAGRLDESESEYRVLLARNPAAHAARWRLSRLLAGSGRRAEAAAVLREGAGRSAWPVRLQAEAASLQQPKPSDSGEK